MKKGELKDVVKEAKILRKVDHKHIIRSYAHFIEDDALNIIMEFAEGGDLQKVTFSTIISAFFKKKIFCKIKIPKIF